MIRGTMTDECVCENVRGVLNGGSQYMLGRKGTNPLLAVTGPGSTTGKQILSLLTGGCLSSLSPLPGPTSSLGNTTSTLLLGSDRGGRGMAYSDAGVTTWPLYVNDVLSALRLELEAEANVTFRAFKLGIRSRVIFTMANGLFTNNFPLLKNYSTKMQSLFGVSEREGASRGIWDRSVEEGSRSPGMMKYYRSPKTIHPHFDLSYTSIFCIRIPSQSPFSLSAHVVLSPNRQWPWRCLA